MGIAELKGWGATPCPHRGTIGLKPKQIRWPGFIICSKAGGKTVVFGTGDHYNLYPSARFMVKVFTVTSPPIPVLSFVQSAIFVKSR